MNYQRVLSQSSKLFLFIIFIIFISSCKKETPEINNGEETDSKIYYPSYIVDIDTVPIKNLVEKLNALPDVTIEEITTNEDFLHTFQIDVTQPVDHNNPDGPTFKQRIFLNHVDSLAPMVLATNGYGAWPASYSELNSLFESNLIVITHRYFPNALPGSPIDWQYLTIEQAAADHHHIVDIFKRIYGGKWVNTGVSKGGMTVMYHKRFYPDDVDATVAYVAPLMFGIPDPRFNDFLKNEVSTPECRQKVRDFQKLALENKTNLIPFLESYETSHNIKFPLGYDYTIEYTVLEYEFYYWQFGSNDCSSIPGNDATYEEIFDHLDQESGFKFYEPWYLDYYAPLYYQVFTEFGYYTFNTDHLDGLITLINPTHELLAPQNVSMTFDQSKMKDIESWIQNYGNNMIFIYGEIDPYTAAAVELTGQTNAIKIIQPGANHTVKIKDLDNKIIVHNALEEWLDVEVSEKKFNIESKHSIKGKI